MREFVGAIRHILLRWVGLDEDSAKLFFTYSLRRMMPTLGGILKVHRLEALATGNWTGAPTDMPARYAGEKSDAARQIKLTYVFLLRAAVRADIRPMHWAAVRAFATEEIVKEARNEALVSLAADRELKTVPQDLLQGLVAPRKRFKLRGLKIRKVKVPERVTPEAVGATASTAAVDTQIPDTAELPWVVTQRSGTPVVHVLTQNKIPFCDRRQQVSKAKPFKRYRAAGDNVGSLKLMPFDMADKCERCWAHLPADLGPSPQQPWTSNVNDHLIVTSKAVGGENGRKACNHQNEPPIRCSKYMRHMVLH